MARRATLHVSAAAALAVASAGTNANATAVTFTQRSAWVLDYADEHCSLNRVYGAAPDVIYLQIASYGSYSDFKFLIFGQQMPQSTSLTGKLRFWFSNDAAPREDASALWAPVGKTPGVSFRSYFRSYEAEPDWTHMTAAERFAYDARAESPQADFERASTALTIEVEPKKQITLHLGSMIEPLNQLRQCVDAMNMRLG